MIVKGLYTQTHSIESHLEECHKEGGTHLIRVAFDAPLSFLLQHEGLAKGVHQLAQFSPGQLRRRPPTERHGFGRMTLPGGACELLCECCQISSPRCRVEWTGVEVTVIALAAAEGNVEVDAEFVHSFGFCLLPWVAQTFGIVFLGLFDGENDIKSVAFKYKNQIIPTPNDFLSLFGHWITRQAS